MTPPTRLISTSDVTVDLSSHPSNTPLGMLLAPSFVSQKNKSNTHSKQYQGNRIPSTDTFTSNNNHNNNQKNNQQHPDDATTTVVAGWERLPNGKFGPVQKCGLVRLGDSLKRVNMVNVCGMTFRQIMTLLKSLSSSSSSGGGGGGIRSLTFAPLESCGDDNNSRGDYNMNDGCHSSKHPTKRYTFTSSICRARIRNNQNDDDEQTTLSPALSSNNNNNGNDAKSFVEYEISCCLIINWRGNYGGGYHNNNNRTNSSSNHGSGPNEDYQLMKIDSDGEEKRWSVWKRFSEFKQIDTSLRKAYSWQIHSLQNKGTYGVPTTIITSANKFNFPSHKPLSSMIRSLHPTFIEIRTHELNCYWNTMLQNISEITDFDQPHKYSRDLATFLCMEHHLDFFVLPPLNTAVKSSLSSSGQKEGSSSNHSGGSVDVASANSSTNDDDGISNILVQGPYHNHHPRTPMLDASLDYHSNNLNSIEVPSSSCTEATPINSRKKNGRKKRIAAKSALQRRGVSLLPPPTPTILRHEQSSPNHNGNQS